MHLIEISTRNLLVRQSQRSLNVMSVFVAGSSLKRANNETAQSVQSSEFNFFELNFMVVRMQ